jgi:hypothetical protein
VNSSPPVRVPTYRGGVIPNSRRVPSRDPAPVLGRAMGRWRRETITSGATRGAAPLLYSAKSSPKAIRSYSRTAFSTWRVLRLALLGILFTSGVARAAPPESQARASFLSAW